MTDLFARLVDRALDRTPVLQRRQPTLFEPVAATAFSEQSQPETGASLEEKETVTESTLHSDEQKRFVNNVARRPQLSSPGEEPQSQAVETQSARRRRIHDASPEPQNDQDNASTETLASVKETTKTISREGLPSRESKPTALAKPQEISIEPARLIETIVERKVDREIIKEHSTDNPAIKKSDTVAQLDSQPKPSPDHDKPQPQQPLKAEVKRLTRPKEQNTIRPLVQEKPSPRRDPAPIVRPQSRAESKEPSKQPTPPIIHVTIGRIEVRATPPATARPRVAHPIGPKMSLEDYLRSRGKGN